MAILVGASAAYFLVGWLISLLASYKVGCLEAQEPYYPSSDWDYWCNRARSYGALTGWSVVLFWPIVGPIMVLSLLAEAHHYRKMSNKKRTLKQRLQDLGYKHGCKLK